MAKIAWIGLGVMGYPMAGHLLKRGGHDLVVYNRTFAKAEKWVAEHGAGVANIVFCGDGARVLELFSPVTVQPAHWSLASVSKLAYGFQVGASRSGLRDWSEHYVIDCATLRRNLEVMASA